MNRRFFFRDIALSTAGFYLFPAFTYTRGNYTWRETDVMEKLFMNPPDSCGPWVMWYWMNSHVTKEGITLDLEMLTRSGFRGAFCCRYDMGIPSGSVKSGSNEWLEVMNHSIREADRLGLELVFQCLPGFTDDKSARVPPEYKRQKLVWSEVTVPVNRKVYLKLLQPVQRKEYYRDVSVLAFPAAEAEKQMVVDPESVIDVTPFVNKKGWLKWETTVTGKWTIVRIGHTIPEGEPQMDFFRKEAMNWLLKNNSTNLDQFLTGHSLRGFFGFNRHPDPLTWTTGFDQTFSNRLNYSLKPWLLSLTGKVVGSAVKSEHFLEDFGQIQQELYSENFEKSWIEWCHQKGLKWYSIPSELFDTELISWKDSAALKEFKAPGQGKESFAVLSASSPKGDSPGEIKFGSDELYSLGYSNLLISPFVHQPYMTGLPGMSATFPGIALGRNNIWSDGLSGLTKYLGRTQFLMQLGSPVADFCVFRGDHFSYNSTQIVPFLPSEYPFEVIDRYYLAQCTVDEGIIKHPGGSMYHLCMLASGATLFPETLKLIIQLVEKGMILVTVQKPVITYRLSVSEDDMTRFSDRLFGNLDGVTNRKHDLEKGKVYLGVPVNEILDQLPVQADFTLSSVSRDAAIRISHRKAGDTHLYNLFNTGSRSEKINCSFRINNLKPEIWNCETGEIVPAPIYYIIKGRLRMPLEIPSSGSVFIIFRKKFGLAFVKKITIDGNLFMDNEPLKYKGSSRYAEVTDHVSPDAMATESVSPLSFLSRQDGSLKGLFLQNGVYNFQISNENVEEYHTFYVENCFTVPLDSSWVIHFPDGSGAPLEMVPEKLESLTMNSNFNIRHFSGTCTYSTLFYLADSDFIPSRKILLDLGKVELIARINVNGMDAGLVWKKPFIADITALVNKGENILKVDVTNSWHNRMTGDESLPTENDYNNDGTIIKLPDWFIRNLPKPGERKTFTVKKCVSKDDPLFDSGLIGPVKLIFAEERVL